MMRKWKIPSNSGLYGRLDICIGCGEETGFCASSRTQTIKNLNRSRRIFFGLAYTGDLANFIDWTVFYYGAHAIEELLLLRALADALRAQGKPVNFFDVGANIGHHSLFMSQHADRVFSFEPYSVVRLQMERKFNHAGVRNATIYPVALGNRNETATFHPPTGANLGTGTLGDVLPGNASMETISVDVVRGDDFLPANRMPAISLLKMDVEGFETNVLEGMREKRCGETGHLS
jgi:FkbM family methyltransferase